MLNFDFVLRLLVAGILGAIIGLDREYRAKEAGYRTHFLVSLGSALIMIVSQYGCRPNPCRCSQSSDYLFLKDNRSGTDKNNPTDYLCHHWLGQGISCQRSGLSHTLSGVIG